LARGAPTNSNSSCSKVFVIIGERGAEGDLVLHTRVLCKIQKGGESKMIFAP
jgi:hypothetical protein